MIARIRFMFQVARAHGIARRYFATNGFDGALAMLGLNTGMYASGGVPPRTALGACLGTALALAVSGVSSAYLSESAEQRKKLQELEKAMATDLTRSALGAAARVTPFVIAAVNGIAPLVVSLFVVTPLVLAHYRVPLPLGALELTIIFALIGVFLIGVFLGRVGGTFWLWSGLRALLIAVLTGLLILLLEL